MPCDPIVGYTTCYGLKVFVDSVTPMKIWTKRVVNKRFSTFWDSVFCITVKCHRGFNQGCYLVPRRKEQKFPNSREVEQTITGYVTGTESPTFIKA